MKRHGALVTPVKCYGARWGFDDYWSTGERIQIRRLTKSKALTAHTDLKVLIANGRKDLARIEPAELAEFRQWKSEGAKSKTIREAIDQFIALKRGASSRHYQSLRMDLEVFANFIGDHRLLTDVAPPEFQEFLDAQMSGLRRKYNLLAAAKSLYKWARRQGFVPDRSTAPEKTEPLKKLPGQVNIVSPETMATLLGHVHLKYLPWLATGAFAMVRTEEIRPDRRSKKRPLHWEDFKWGKGYIDIPPETAKTNERRLTPIPKNLAACLAPWRNSKGPICKHQPTENETKRLGKLIGGWKNNMLRDSGITYRCAFTQNVYQVAYEAGNSVSMIKRSYHEARDKREARKYYSIMPPRNIIPVTTRSQDLTLKRSHSGRKVLPFTQGKNALPR